MEAAHSVSRQVPSSHKNNAAYYSKLPFLPGNDLFHLLGPIGGKKRTRPSSAIPSDMEGVPRNRHDGCLHVRIPYTLSISGSEKSILEYDEGVVTRSVAEEFDDGAFVKEMADIAAESKKNCHPMIAVRKITDWTNPEAQENAALTETSLKRELESAPNKCVFQQFVKSRGAKPTVFRSSWCDNKPVTVYSIVSNVTFVEVLESSSASKETEAEAEITEESPRSNDGAEDDENAPPKAVVMDDAEISSWICPSTADRSKLSMFKMSPLVTEPIQEMLKRVTKHLESALSAHYGIPAIRFQEMTCDFLKDDNQDWYLLGIRSFTLTETSYAVTALLHETSAANGGEEEFSDSEDEGENTKGNSRKGRVEHRVPRFSLDSCKLCGADCKKVAKKQAAEEDNKSGVNRYEITQTMGNLLMTQLSLQGHPTHSFADGLLMQMSQSQTAPGSVGQLYQVCRTCHAIWEANDACFKAGKQLGSCILGGNPHDVQLPGDPGYGETPGSVAKILPECTQHAKAQISCRLASEIDNMTYTTSERARCQPKQYRMFLFFQDLFDVDESILKENVLNLEYSLQPNHNRMNTVQCRMDNQRIRKINDSAFSVQIRKVVCHYLLSNLSSLQQYFLSKSIPLRVTLANNRVYSGVLYLSRFLTSLSSKKFKPTMVNFTIDLHDEMDASQSISVGVSVGIMGDAVDASMLDPNMPLDSHDSVFYYPTEYYDLKPIPTYWLEGILARQHAIEKMEMEKNHRAMTAQKEEEERLAKPFLMLRRTSSTPAVDLDSIQVGGDFWVELDRWFDQIYPSSATTISRSTIVEMAMEKANEPYSIIDWAALVMLLHTDEKAPMEGRKSPTHLMHRGNVLIDAKISDIANQKSPLEHELLTRIALVRLLKLRVAEIEAENDFDEEDEYNKEHSGIVKTVGAFSSRTRRHAVARRTLRFGIYAKLWREIDADKSGTVDLPELRGFMNQRPTMMTQEGRSRDYTEWSLRDINDEFGYWLSHSGHMRKKFRDYETHGTGEISWREFVTLGDKWFSSLHNDSLAFAASKSMGFCEKHGKVPLYAIDLCCTECVIEKHDPRKLKASGLDLLNIIQEEEDENLRTTAKRIADYTGRRKISKAQQLPKINTQEESKEQGSGRSSSSSSSKKKIVSSAADSQSSKNSAMIQQAEIESLFVYCKHGNLEMAQQLLEKATGMAVNDVYEGMTSLHVAAAHGHVEVCKLLLKQGADLNTKDENGLTPVQLALSNGQNIASVYLSQLE